MLSTDVRDRLLGEIDRWADELVSASHDIHARPELAWEERYAHDRLAGVLEDAGIETERSAYDLETAFAGRAGSEGPIIAVMCEYDALPGIGHACGHNIIGTAGLGAAIALAKVADELGGRLVVLGTPAEEGGGGKIFLARRGALDGVAAALMVHPASADLRSMDVIAVQRIRVTYRGQSAHASAAPWSGRNALDAMVLGYNNVAALRQHIRPRERVHGIFLQSGDAPNIVPDHTEALYYVRSPKVRGLQPLKSRVLACLEGGAHATGCELHHEWVEPVFSEMVVNDVLADRYAANSAAIGRPLVSVEPGGGVAGSTDMGNVSFVVPSIHPMIRVSPPDVPIHSPEFTRYAASPDGDAAVIDGAKAMALTVADLWAAPALLEAVGAEFARAVPEPGLPDA